MDNKNKDTQEVRGKVLRGTVVKTAAQKTATVAVARYMKHPKYGKFIKKVKRYLVHDPESKARVGDAVSIRETRPVSKRKFFEIVG